MLIQPGIYPSDVDYDSIEAVNISRLLLAATSPLHYHRGSRRDTKPMAFGRAAHCATLEPERFARDFMIWETTYRGGEKVGGKVKGEGDKRPRSGNAWEAFVAEAELRGCSVVTDLEFQEARTIAEAVRTDEVAGPILAHGKAEQCLVWTIDGVLCKGRVDWLPPTGLWDLKVAADVTERGFSRAAARYGYHARMAWYADAIQVLTGACDPVGLIAVEAEAPHDVVVYEMPPEVLDIGRDEYHRLLGIVRDCQASGDWPGIGRRTRRTLSLPAYLTESENDTGGLGLINDIGGQNDGNAQEACGF